MARSWIAISGLLAACANNPKATSDDGSCQHLVSCGELSSVDDCHRLLGSASRPPQDDLEAAIAAGKVVFDPASETACDAARASSACFIPGNPLRQPDACWAVYRGTVHAGGSCALNVECISRRCDVPACGQACCTGTCVGDRALGTGEAGDPCSMDDSCHTGLYCKAGSCVALLSEGAPCTSSASCADDLICEGVCVAQSKLGDPCDGDTCGQIGTFCSPTRRICVKLALRDEPCGPDAKCSPYYRCDPATSRCSLGTALPLGASCQAGDWCADPGAYCALSEQGDVRCLLVQPDGAPCDAYRICANGACDPTTNTCKPGATCI